MKVCLSVQQNELFWSYLGPESLAGRVGALGLAPALIIPSAPCPYRCLHSLFLAGRSQGIPVFREGSQIPLFIFFSQVKSPKHHSIQVISLFNGPPWLSHSIPDSHPALCCLSPTISSHPTWAWAAVRLHLGSHVSSSQANPSHLEWLPCGRLLIAPPPGSSPGPLG